ncbi:hypothetical protein GCM10023189_43240 [Nibrella saemangeumensis]|uniref:Phage protein, HK97 gp10 family n=1 Tax=Nibrella saemangeumensis TaxID=1084526 RepID=A0ABP8NE03_9BACT
MFTTNADEAITTLGQIRGGLLTVEQKADEELLDVARMAVQEVAGRIQMRGENTAGQLMQTKSQQTIGRYSRTHGQRRQQAGLTTSIVNLTFTGDMMESFTAMPDATGVGVGFASDAMSERADYIEAYFGTAFQPTQAEEQFLSEQYQQRIYNQLDQQL